MRKGAEIALNAYKRWLRIGTIPRNSQMYFKTSKLSDGSVMHYKTVKHPRTGLDFAEASLVPQFVPSLPGVVVDSRNLPASELLALYNSAHAFILPSTGEGWGLTLTEAFSTGAPCIWTAWSGPVDYADEKIGYPVKKFSMLPLWDVNKNKEITKGMKPEAYAVKPDEMKIIHKMNRIYHNYEEALERGRKASERMHTQFTWEQAAERFIEICEDFLSKQGGNPGRRASKF